MGRMKRVLEQQEEQYQDALMLLIEVGAIAECDVHEGTYFDGDEDVTEAYKLANSRITSGEIALPDGMTRTDYTDLIQHVYDDNSAADGCYECERSRD